MTTGIFLCSNSHREIPVTNTGFLQWQQEFPVMKTGFPLWGFTTQGKPWPCTGLHCVLVSPQFPQCVDSTSFCFSHHINWKILTSIRLFWHPAQLIKSNKRSLGSSKDEFFSCFLFPCHTVNKTQPCPPFISNWYLVWIISKMNVQFEKK